MSDGQSEVCREIESTGHKQTIEEREEKALATIVLRLYATAQTLDTLNKLRPAALCRQAAYALGEE